MHTLTRSEIDLRTYKPGQDPEFDEEVRRMTPGERIELTWQISRAVWMWETGSVDEPVFRRDIVRVIRRRGNHLSNIEKSEPDPQ
jgi:hypothetical protein